MIEFSPVCVIRHYFLIPFRWRIRHCNNNLFQVETHYFHFSLRLDSIGQCRCPFARFSAWLGRHSSINHKSMHSAGGLKITSWDKLLANLLLFSCYSISEFPTCFNWVKAFCKEMCTGFCITKNPRLIRNVPKLRFRQIQLGWFFFYAYNFPVR